MSTLRRLTAVALFIIAMSPAAAAVAAPTPRPPDRVVARATTALVIYARRGDAAPAATLPATTAFGTARALFVTKRAGRWLEVLLPERPNGARGWVRRADVELRAVRDDIVVDLTARTLTWHRDGAIVVTSPVAVGAPETPTPVGRFFVTDLLDTPDGGAYGPFAIGLSAHSDTLSEFGGGDGQIGVHGTSDPASIGQAVSHGCVRVPNELIAQLATSLPLGTPVVIR